MSCTEEEAKTKWCPFARNVESGIAGNSAARNRVTLIDDEPPTKLAAELIGVNCIGSACMAWRWKLRFGTHPNKPEDCTELPPTHGSCGLTHPQGA